MSIEKYFSEKLRRNPKMRNMIKKSYQLGMITLKMGYVYSTKKKYLKDAEGVLEGEENYFGYYDKSPWNMDEDKILTMKVPYSHIHPKNVDKAIVGYVDLTSKSFVEIGETLAWNLQQGCMLQWLGPDFKNFIIYNAFRNNKYVAVIYDLKKKTERIIDKPVYSVNSDGSFALSLNFSRLHSLRPGYGYSAIKDETEGMLAPEDDGIYLVDLENNSSKLIISTAEIVNIEPDESMNGVEHKFNHIEFSPEGNRFMFLHRWRNSGIGYSRLFTANLDGSDIYCLADDVMISHSCWRDNEHVLSWSRKKSIGDRYFLYKDKSKEFKVIGEGILNCDGHPSYSPDKKYILTDTYPDKYRIKTLIIYDTLEEKRYDLAKFYAPFKYDGEVRCDFHPRWSRSGKYISFDSVHEGYRNQYIIKNPFYNV